MTYTDVLHFSRVLPDSLEKVGARVQLARLRNAMQSELEIYQAELDKIREDVEEEEPQNWPEDKQQELQELLSTKVEAELPQISESKLSDEDDLSTTALQLLIKYNLLG